MIRRKHKFRFYIFILIFFHFYLSIEATGQQEKITLIEILRLAREKNPGLQAIQELIRAYQFQVVPQTTLPDPILNFSLKNMGATEFTVGQEMMSGFGFSVSQMIPFPGKLRLQGEIADLRVRRIDSTREIYILSLSRQIKELYAQLFYYQRALEVLTKKKVFLEKALQVAAIRYSVSSGALNDVFKARLEIAEIEKMIQPMDQMIRATEGQINSLLMLPIEKHLGLAEEIPIYKLDLSLEELFKAAKAHSPKLKEAKIMIEEKEKEVELSRREFLPNFMIQVGKDFKGPFRDMYEIMVGIEVPIFFKRKQANLLEAAVAELNQVHYSLVSMEKELEAMINENYFLAKSAEKVLKITRDHLLPQASLALESSLANYQVGKVDFLALLTDIDSLFSYEMENYRHLNELWKALARLDELTGLNLLGEDKNEN